MMRNRLFHDARDFQILFLFTFLTLGIFERDWTLRPDTDGDDYSVLSHRSMDLRSFISLLPSPQFAAP